MRTQTQTLKLQGLEEQIRALVTEILDELKSRKEESNLDLMSPKEVQKELNISYPTLWRWEKSGNIRLHRLNGRVYVKKSEILKQLK